MSGYLDVIDVTELNKTPYLNKFCHPFTKGVNRSNVVEAEGHNS